MTATASKFANWKKALARNGLNLVFAMPLADLPSAIRSQLPAEAGTPDGDQSLVMVGNGGNSFWHALPDEYGGPDPIDRFTASVVSNTINEHFGNCEWHLLYPGTSPITLQQLGALALMKPPHRPIEVNPFFRFSPLVLDLQGGVRACTKHPPCPFHRPIEVT